jgi:hypothetical protein
MDGTSMARVSHSVVFDDAPIAAVLDGIEARQREVVQAMTDAIVAEIPTYGENSALVADVRAHVDAHVAGLLLTARRGSSLEPDEVGFVRATAQRRIEQSIPLEDILHAFRIGQRIYWQAILQEADARTVSARDVLPLALATMTYVDAISTEIATAYLEAERRFGADRERAQRDLLDRLLAGRAVDNPVHRKLLEQASLTPAANVLVVSARAGPDSHDTAVLRAFAHKLAPTVGMLAVVRENELVAILACQPNEARSACTHLLRIHNELVESAEVESLRVGVSTLHSGLAAIPNAYREADWAREATRESTFLAVCQLRLSAYLTLAADQAASRLIPDQVRALFERDSRRGSPLAAALRAYASTNLNARRAAEELQLHVNTFTYRLNRVKEQTGYDPRRFDDLVELLNLLQVLTRGQSERGLPH